MNLRKGKKIGYLFTSSFYRHGPPRDKTGCPGKSVTHRLQCALTLPAACVMHNCIVHTLHLCACVCVCAACIISYVIRAISAYARSEEDLSRDERCIHASGKSIGLDVDGFEVGFVQRFTGGIRLI